MTITSLQGKLDRAGGAVKLLRDTAHGAETGPIIGGEFSNWNNEQLSWRETCGLFDLSHHMTVVWGEQDGGSAKPQVERHVQTDIRATVSHVAYGDVYNK